MTKPSSAAYAARGAPAPMADAATSVFRHLGEASQRLMQLQAQAASIVLTESAARCAEVLGGMLGDAGVGQWTQMQRSQVRSAMQPLEAWMEAVTGLQAVLAAAFMQACALTAFPAATRAERPRAPDRRTDSVVIQFPDRRRNVAA